MPTDLGAAFARKRKAQTDKQAGTTMISVWLIIWLAMLVLVFVDQSFVKAARLMAVF